MIGAQELIAEIAEQYHVLVDANDPIFVSVTLHRRVLEDAIAEALNLIDARMAKLEQSLYRAEERAGQILSERVLESVRGIRGTIHADIGAASIRAEEFVQRVQRAHSEAALKRWAGIGLLCAAILFACGVWLGRLFAVG